MLDCTDSMKTTEAKILASVAFETVCKFLEGLARPFRIKHSQTGAVTKVSLEINVSIIGMGHSSWRVLLHNHPVKSENIMHLAQVIYKSIINFENENIKVLESLVNVQENNPFGDSSMLNVGIFILDLMDKDAIPSLIIVTDGVSLDLFLASEETNQAIIKDMIHVCICQTGSGAGFTPTSNFGHIPNNEDLMFLSQRADGTFIYADDCPYVVSVESNQDSDPNFFHDCIAIKNISLSDVLDEETLDSSVGSGSRRRLVDEIRTKFINTKADVPHKATPQELSFPWTFESKPPYIAEILCSYRNYRLPNIPIVTILKTRMNQGFTLRKLKKVENQSKKLTKVEIVLILPLAPHVKIIYAMKFSVPFGTDILNYSPAKGARIEINVLAHHSFAILFINVHNLDPSKTDTISGVLYKKLIRLHNVLKNLSEADETLQILCQFNVASAIQLSNEIAGSTTTVVPSPIVDKSIELPSNYWHYLNQAILVKPWLLDLEKIVIVLKSTSTQTNLGARALNALKPSNNTDSHRARYQVSTIYLSRFLNSWASFSISKTAHLKWLFGSGAGEKPIGFCLMQLLWETESLMSLNLRFFGASAEERRRISERFKADLIELEQINRSGYQRTVKPIVICEKPLDTFLVYYTPLESTLHDNIGLETFKPNETLARSYLLKKSWVWFSDVCDYKDDILVSILDAGYIHLYNGRISEDYSRAAEGPGCVTFYKEIVLADSHQTIAVQYVLLFNLETKFLSSELWIEPLKNLEKDEYLADFIIKEIYNKVHHD